MSFTVTIDSTSPLRDLGHGFDHLSGKVRGIAVVSSTENIRNTAIDGDPDLPFSQKFEGQVERIESREELRKALNVDARFEYDGILNSASGHAQFFRCVDQNRYSLHLFVRATVTNEATRLTRYELTEQASQFLVKNGGQDFYEKYGTHFVASVVTGGELILLYEFSFQSEEQKQVFSSQIQASIGSFDGAASLSQKLESMKVSQASDLKWSYVGPPAKDTQIDWNNPQSIVALVNQMQDLMQPSAANQRVIKAFMLDYRVVGSVDPDDLVNVATVQRFQTKLGLRKGLLEEEESSLDYALSYPQQFMPFDQAEARNVLSRIDSELETIDDCFFRSTQNPTMSGLQYDLSNPIPTVGLSWVLPKTISLEVLVHLQGIGDQVYRGGEFSGTRGQSRRLEGFRLRKLSPFPGLRIEYMAHLQGSGDTPWTREGSFVGSRGQSRRLEGFAVRLSGSLADSYSVNYMAHLQGSGDTSYETGPAFCGTRGQSRRLEGFVMRIERRY